jgi:hypothetical protein
MLPRCALLAAAVVRDALLLLRAIIHLDRLRRCSLIGGRR